MLRVLLIDDDQVENRLFEAYLYRCSLEVEFHYKSSLEDGIKTALKISPDVVFLDDRLVPYEGCEQTLPVLRQAGVVSPIIVISAAIDVFNPDRYSDAGADGFVDKSEITLDTIEALIVRHAKAVEALA